MTTIAYSPTIGPVPIGIFVREKHESDLTITKVPVEQGADITDHAFREPDKISIEIVDQNAAATWNALKRFQQSRVPFVLVSGLQVYKNLLIEHMEAERDVEFSKVLRGKVDLSEIIIVGTAYEADTGDESSGGSAAQRGQPGGTKSTRAARPTSQTVKSTRTARQVSGTVSRGDIVTTPASTVAPESSGGGSILSHIAGG